MGSEMAQTAAPQQKVLDRDHMTYGSATCFCLPRSLGGWEQDMKFMMGFNVLRAIRKKKERHTRLDITSRPNHHPDQLNSLLGSEEAMPQSTVTPHTLLSENIIKRSTIKCFLLILILI